MPQGPEFEAGVPATASNPINASSEALGLDADLLNATGWEPHDLSLLATLVKKALKDTKNPNLKPMLRHLVEQMVNKPTLAKRVFGVLQGGDTSCGDRVSLTLYRAQEELLAQPVRDGDLNQNLWAVVDIARKVFRRRSIFQLAENKVKAINEARTAQGLPPHGEEVETHLAYFSELHESLELGGQKPEAKYTSFLSGVTREDVEAAKEAVLMEEGEQEGKNLWDFLATWEPWQTVLSDLFPDQVARIKDKLADLDRVAKITREVTEEVERAMRPGRERNDAITRALGQRGKEDALGLWLPLTMKALRNQRS